SLLLGGLLGRLAGSLLGSLPGGLLGNLLLRSLLGRLAGSLLGGLPGGLLGNLLLRDLLLRGLLGRLAGNLLGGLLHGLLGRLLRSFLGSHGQLLVSWLGLPSHKSQRHRHGIGPVAYRRQARGLTDGFVPARGGAGHKNTRAVTGPGAGFEAVVVGGGDF